MAEKQSGVFIFTPFDRQAIELIKQAIKGKARGSSRSDFKSHLKIILRVIRAAMTRSGLPQAARHLPSAFRVETLHKKAQHNR